MFRLSIVVMLVTVGFSYLIFFISPSDSGLVGWINILFICSLLLSLIGAIFYIIQSGFFNKSIRDFKYFFKRINKSEEIINTIEGKDQNKSIHAIKIPICYPVLTAGISLFVLSLIISFIIAA